MIIQNNLITDTSIANIALLIDDTWYTPHKPLLFGTTRQRHIDSGKLQIADLTLKDFKNAKKIALMNAMIDFDLALMDEDVMLYIK